MIRVGDRPRALPIDEPVAEALRSRGELTVGESREYRVRLEGVFKTNGACRVRLLDLDKIVVGKITDPSVGSAGNVYTRALNDGAELIVVAKPTMKDGNINRLFISDARAA
ncbi:conserved protein of unknown function [Methylocella tundrae]|uniref:DUF7947 domain-containing protein n=2 Tax=Methylocella tundrae TaxID=227605 RepID=A0A4U8YY87_METTU|nr:conserved protein of unknown function [Methylocella tundrae]